MMASSVIRKSYLLVIDGRQILGIGHRNCCFKSRSSSAICEPSTSQQIRLYSSDEAKNRHLDVSFAHGLPVLQIPLPSRDEKCSFALKPIAQTVGDLYSFVKEEDKGIDIVKIYDGDGSRISTSTPISHLVQMLVSDDSSCVMRVNDRNYKLRADKSLMASYKPPNVDGRDSIDDLKKMVAGIYSYMNIDEHQLEIERRLIENLEHARDELRPLEEQRQKLATTASRRANTAGWIGLTAMCIQTGLFARLTWWEYSWDIMEPVTYFATYATVLATAAYYLVTKQSFDYPVARDRFYLGAFHKLTKSSQFDVQTYNSLRDKIARLETELSRLRDPLQLHLPPSNAAQKKRLEKLLDWIDSNDVKNEKRKEKDDD